VSITTHILDLARGKPAADVTIQLLAPDGGVRHGRTDADGRCRDLLAPGPLLVGTWRLEFDIGSYQRSLGNEPFYPRAVIEFLVSEPNQHFHIPLLLSPFGYSTYRGS
jgi:5-hydroxyisourate hydrolase